uniref:RRM domain-containing protein n=1 Tax=Schizophyllum commune (strain H4-8 / FGSC 9210) TaxID=578458 RepID=D8Q385_SCHCM
MAPTTLGKRKERESTVKTEEEGAGDGTDSSKQCTDKHSSTLFVSNLPYAATSTDLQTLFSDIAPVRSAFVVTQQGTGVSKGVGYVSFAIKEDAQGAYDKIAAEGIKLNGRALRVEWADTKKKDDSKPATVKPKAPHTPKAPRAPISHDPNAIRTIVISGLPSGIDQKTLWKKVRKYDGAESVQWPASVGGAEDKSTAEAIFKTPAAATNAVTKLHAHVFKGALLSVTLKKRLESLLSKPVKAKTATSDAKDKPSASTSTAPSHASRLIVRNLPFDITEQDLRAIFLPYGPIYSITIPSASAPTTGEDADGRRTSGKKGFAFVWMMSKKDAERALAGCNGMKSTSLKKRERIIAVDWALSKDRWEEEKAKLEEAGESSASGSDSDSDVSDDSDSDGESSDSHVGVHDDDNASASEDDGSDAERDEDEEAPVKPTLPDTDVGTTLFIRNVPYDATEDELRTLFRAFGPLRYARITKDPETGRGRGTGFACYWNKEDADKVILQSDTLRAETQALPITLPKPNPFTLPSLLTPDPSSSLAQSLVLHGRTLDVVRAVTRSTADKLREDGLKRREKADKRHAYLLREGVILPSMPAAASLAPADLERRTNSYNARRKLLQSNPSLYISRTRLSVRQLPLFATERMLKRLAMHAVRTFEDEVKAGQREALTADELEERDEEADAAALKTSADAHAKDAPPKKRGKFTGRPQRVKQTKVIRQAERVDAVTGRARSKGYGFIEMSTHADALRVLRWANNNGGLAPLWREWWLDEVKDLAEKERKKPAGEKDETRLKRLEDELKTGAAAQKARGTLIVEFSIENVQVVKRRQEKVSGGGKDGAEGKRGHKKDSEDAERPSKRRRTDDEDERPSRTKQGSSGKRDRRESTGDKKYVDSKVKAKRSSTNGDDDAPRKKARLADTGSEGGKDSAKMKEGGKAPNPLGSIIGRKRKERKKKGGKA